MASQQGPLREGAVWDGELEPWKVENTGTSEKADYQAALADGTPPASEMGGP